MVRFLVLITILWTCAACQAAPLAASDASPAPPSSPPTLPRPATLTPRRIAPATAVPSATLAPSVEPTIIPSPDTPTDTPITDGMVIGYSVEGRALTLRRFGSGERVLMLMGGIHGGWEANTVELMQRMIDHFTQTPQDVPPGTSLIIVPLVNPDGYAYGEIPRGRFNGDGVDLNRNWSCAWSSEAFWRDERVSPGVRAMSEPETQALAALLLRIRPAALLSYHSAANGVFAGECDGDHGSAAMAAVFGEAAGYPHDAPFSAYPVTGTAVSWADGQGIPAADVELASHDDPEYARNLRGVLALLEWLTETN